MDKTSTIGNLAATLKAAASKKQDDNLEALVNFAEAGDVMGAAAQLAKCLEDAGEDDQLDLDVLEFVADGDRVDAVANALIGSALILAQSLAIAAPTTKEAGGVVVLMSRVVKALKREANR